MSIKLNDSGPQVARWRQVMAAMFAGYARTLGPLDPGSVYGARAQAWQEEYERRTGQTVDGIVSDQDLANLGIVTPPPPARHAMLTIRGTGGIIGQDYTSVIAQHAPVEEVPLDYAASMGGLPVGAAGNVGDPSGSACVDQAYAMGRDWIRANPTRSFVLGGYSLGAIAASLLRRSLEPDGELAQYRKNLVCGVTLGNPSRAFGHTYYLGAIPNGQGISDFHLGAYILQDWSWCDLAHPDDLYTNTPLGATGDIIEQFYKIIMGTAVSDPLGTMARMLPPLIQAVEDALGTTGTTVPGGPGGLMGLLGGGLLGGAAGIASLLPAVLPMLVGLIGSLAGGSGAGGLNANATGPVAAVQAMILALKFFGSGTGPHISYQTNEVWPGQTYLGLGIQHVNDWCSRTPVTT